MPVWRDCWEGNPQVLVISPFQPTPDGYLPQAIIVLDRAQEQEVVTVSRRHGAPISFAVPPELRDGERRNVESCIHLKLLSPPRTP